MVTASKASKVSASKPSSHGVRNSKKAASTAASTRKKKATKKTASKSASMTSEDERDSIGDHRSDKHSEKREDVATAAAAADPGTTTASASATPAGRKKRATAKTTRKTASISATTKPSDGKASGKGAKKSVKRGKQPQQEEELRQQQEQTSQSTLEIPFLSEAAIDNPNHAFASSFDQRNDPQATGDYHPLNEQMGPPSPINMGLSSNSFGYNSSVAVMRTSNTSNKAQSNTNSDLNNIIGNLPMGDDMGVRQDDWDILNQDSFGFNLGQGTLSLSFSSTDDHLVLPPTETGHDGNIHNTKVKADAMDIDDSTNNITKKKHTHSVDLTNAVTESRDSHCGKPAIRDINDINNSIQKYSQDQRHSNTNSRSSPSYDNNIVIPPTPPSAHSAPVGSSHHHYQGSRQRGEEDERESRNDRHHRHHYRNSRSDHHSMREDSEGIIDHRYYSNGGHNEYYPPPSQDNRNGTSPSSKYRTFRESKSEDQYYDRQYHSYHRSSRSGRSNGGSSKRSSSRHRHRYGDNHGGAGGELLHSPHHSAHSPPPLPNIESAPLDGSWGGDGSGHDGKRYKSERSSNGRPSSRERSRERASRQHHATTISMSRSHPQPPKPPQVFVGSSGRAASWAATSGPRRPHARYPNGSPSNNANANSGGQQPQYFHPHPHPSYPPPSRPPPQQAPPQGAPAPSLASPNNNANDGLPLLVPPQSSSQHPPTHYSQMGYPYRLHPPYPMHHPRAPPPHAPPSNNANSNDPVHRAFLPPPPPQFPSPSSDGQRNIAPPREVYILPTSSSNAAATIANKPPPHYLSRPPHHGGPPPPHPHAHHSPYHPPHPYHPRHHPGHHVTPLSLTGASLLQSPNGGPTLSRDQAPGIGWPAEEDVILTDVLANHKSPVDWDVIAREHGRGRSARECHDRWTRYLRPGARKGQWREEEDAIVLRVIATSPEHPFTQWADLAPQLPGRSGKQIRDRWVNYLNPAINHLPFSREDDLRLWNGHTELGKRWVEISVKIFNSTRSENHIKNRWYSAAFKKFIANEFGPNAYVDAKAGIADDKISNSFSSSQDADDNVNGTTKVSL